MNHEPITHLPLNSKFKIQNSKCGPWLADAVGIGLCVVAVIVALIVL